MTTKNPGFITIKEAATLLDRSTSIVRNEAYAGNFEYRTEHEGKRVFTVVRRSDVEMYKAARDANAARPKTKVAEFPIKREPMDYYDWLVGQVLAGLCANPNFEFRNADDMKCVTQIARMTAGKIVEADILRHSDEGKA